MYKHKKMHVFKSLIWIGLYILPEAREEICLVGLKWASLINVIMFVGFFLLSWPLKDAGTKQLQT